MKIKLLVSLVLLSALIVLPGVVAAQGPETPEDVLQQMVDAGIIASVAGDQVVEVETETIDLTDEDNLFRYVTYGGVMADFVMGGTITWGPGAADDDCGFTLRFADDANYYYAGISQDGQVRFDEIQDNEWQEPILEDTDVITTGEGESNEFIVVGVGGDFMVFVNRTGVLTASDDSVLEGDFGVGMDTYADSAATSCVFDQVWGWNLTESGALPTTGGESDAVELSNYGGEPKAAIAELQDLGLISGASQVFVEDYAYFTGQGSFFTPLARNSPFTNVVMAGELTFTTGTTTDTETCSLLSRVKTDASGSTNTYVEVGIDNSGNVYYVDTADGQTSASDVLPLGLDLTQPHHLLFIVSDNTLTAFVDGVNVADHVEIDAARAGTFGISLYGQDSNARCDGRNIWVYEMD